MHIHLIRHGEVSNPDDIVYANIPGFSLSEKGRSQARAAGARLATSPPGIIVTSPLDRAVETADLVAAPTGAEVRTDSRLTEWALAVRWRGAIWTRLPEVFPGELEAYLDNPRDLPFCAESIDDVAARISSAVTEWVADTNCDLAFVSHQDPLHAAHHLLVGSSPAVFHTEKPEHGSITTLEQISTGWATASLWAPQQ